MGAGKTTVARRLAGLVDAEVVDADRLAGAALASAASDGRLVATFGAEAVAPDGSPNRPWLAQHAFGDPDIRKRLEALVHPPVLAAIEDRIAHHRRGEGPGLLVLDVPLLLETGLDARCDHILFVDAPEPQRRAQAAARGTGASELDRREAAQAPLEIKRVRADLVIPNDDDLDRHLRDCLTRLGFALPRPA